MFKSFMASPEGFITLLILHATIALVIHAAYRGHRINKAVRVSKSRPKTPENRRYLS